MHKTNVYKNHYSLFAKSVLHTSKQWDNVELAPITANQNDEARAEGFDELPRVHAAVCVVHRVAKVEACMNA